MLGVVLVHGFNSSPGMWDAFSDLMAGDEELAEAVVEARPRFGYATALYRWSLTRAIPSLETVADSLKEYLRTEAAPQRFEHLVLVGHSMGGLVIQRYLARMLAEGRGHELARIKHVVLLATPNTGSLLLRDVRRVLLGANAQEPRLRPLNPQVADTLRLVLRDVVNAPAEPTERTCRIGFSVYAGESDNVVPPGSAQAGFPEALALPGDHFTIARPTSHEHRTYATLKRLLLAAANGDPPVQTVTMLGPQLLEVHNAAVPGQAPGILAPLTAYLIRDHDNVLRGAIRTVLDGGPSRLIVLTGESSTGKTRALYEALLALAPDRPLLSTTGRAAGLRELLRSGRVRPGSILWLNEAQAYLDGEHGEAAAGELLETLIRTPGIVALGTMWTEPYWTELTASGQPRDPHAQARQLLTNPAITLPIRVPDHLSDDELDAWRAGFARADTRATRALAAGEGDGRIIQHLSGGPELLQAYLSGPEKGRFTPREHALITAALDARRLGHRNPIPAALLAQAAGGDLAPRHQAADPGWAEQDLRAIATGVRSDGISRTDIRNTLTALTAVRTHGGAAACYEPADYLDQHTRTLRADQLGSASLWQALIEHTTDRDDQERLGDAAWARGLRIIAVRLWHRAVTAGKYPAWLAQLDPVLDPDHAAATYCAAHAELSNPAEVALLLLVLCQVGAWDAVGTLLQRDPAAHAELTDRYAVARLLEALREVGVSDAVAALARRAAAHVELTDPEAAPLLWGLQDAGASDVIATLAGRAAAHVELTDPYAVARLLSALREAGGSDVGATLAGRAAAHVELTDPYAVAFLLRELREAGAPDAVATLLQRDPAAHAELTSPYAVASLLRELREAGGSDAVATLAGRAAAHFELTAPEAVASLLRELREEGASDAVATLAEYAAAHAELTDPEEIARLLGVLRRAGASDAVATLLQRGPAAHAELTDPQAAALLLRELREAGASDAVATLAGRAAAHAELTDPQAAALLLRELQDAGASDAVATLAERAAAHAELTDPQAMTGLLEALQVAGASDSVAALARRTATHAELTDPAEVAFLLRKLREAGASDAVATLLQRGPAAHAELTNPEAVGRLLGVLREADASDAVATLLQRGPAAHVELTNPEAVGRLLGVLREAGASDAVAALAERAAAHAELSDPRAVAYLLSALREAGASDAIATLTARSENAGHDPDRYAPYGREPDGQRTSRWTWLTLLQNPRPSRSQA